MADDRPFICVVVHSGRNNSLHFQNKTDSQLADVAGFPELGPATAAGLFLDRLADFLIKSTLAWDSQESTDFSERRQPSFPASVTPSSARKRQGRRQKVRKQSVFLDWRAI